jgi:hypothetical protein
MERVSMPESFKILKKGLTVFMRQKKRALPGLLYISVVNRHSTISNFTCKYMALKDPCKEYQVLLVLLM